MFLSWLNESVTRWTLQNLILWIYWFMYRVASKKLGQPKKNYVTALENFQVCLGKHSFLRGYPKNILFDVAWQILCHCSKNNEKHTTLHCWLNFVQDLDSNTHLPWPRYEIHTPCSHRNMYNMQTNTSSYVDPKDISNPRTITWLFVFIHLS